MDEETLTVWLDTALLMLGGFVLMTILMMTVMNPPAKSSEADGLKPPGNVIVQIQWPDKLDADVDLWVKAPGDVPVGYSNKSGRSFDLLRDDLGTPKDLSDLNYEIAYSRGLAPGEYIVNVHMYRALGVAFPIPVKVNVTVNKDPAKSTAPLLTTSIDLRKLNQEVTAFRFQIDSKGELVRESVNNLNKGLRVAAVQ